MADDFGAGVQLRCAATAQLEQLDPIGTAPIADGFLLIEWRRPWPKEIAEVAELRDLMRPARDMGLRVQLVAPVGRSRSPLSKVVLLGRDPFRGGGLWRDERSVLPDDLVATALKLLREPRAAIAVTRRAPTDVLVCAHGSRDVCCGAAGTWLANDVATCPGVRVWRTSHLGGHRFVPTAMVLPSGDAWAHLDADSLERVLDRSDLSSVLPQYRGNVWLESPAAQVLDRVVFAEEGWEWTEAERTSTSTSLGPDKWRTHLTFKRSDGTRGRYEGIVRARRQVSIPACRVLGTPTTHTDLAIESWGICTA